jgi:hypothetical protein
VLKAIVLWHWTDLQFTISMTVCWINMDYLRSFSCKNKKKYVLCFYSCLMSSVPDMGTLLSSGYSTLLHCVVLN